MFFDSVYDLIRVSVVGVLAYVGLVVLLRLSGKRTLAKMNAFDLVVTVALGSTLASILLSADVSYAEGVLALILLALLQLVASWLSTRWRAARTVIKSEPALLLRDGDLLMEDLRRERVTAGEVRQALRAQGYGDQHDIAAVVLETDGTFSVIPRGSAGDRSALIDVAGREDDTGATRSADAP
jgi:uncharacterized membrane protein YcaP (DUF421 family)